MTQCLTLFLEISKAVLALSVELQLGNLPTVLYGILLTVPRT